MEGGPGRGGRGGGAGGGGGGGPGGSEMWERRNFGRNKVTVKTFYSFMLLQNIITSYSHS